MEQSTNEIPEQWSVYIDDDGRIFHRKLGYQTPPLTIDDFKNYTGMKSLWQLSKNNKLNKNKLPNTKSK